MKHIKLFEEFNQNESFDDEFYTQNKTHFNDYKKKLSVEDITDEEATYIRYDILAKDLIKEFDINTTSKYFAFAIKLDNGKIIKAYGANSGSDLKDFKLTKVGKKYSAEEFWDLIKKKEVPPYIKEKEVNETIDIMNEAEELIKDNVYKIYDMSKNGALVYAAAKFEGPDKKGNKFFLINKPTEQFAWIPLDKMEDYSFGKSIYKQK